MQVQRLLDSRALPVSGEYLETLLAKPGIRIERILSAPNSYSDIYDQGDDEWVVLLQGQALLEVRGIEIALATGDALLLPVHTPHRVLTTSVLPPCIWLAIHFSSV